MPKMRKLNYKLSMYLMFKGYRSDNFVVGLTNIHPAVYPPVLWKYTLCGQYPGAVPNGATVGVECTNVVQQNLLFRYVIVQFPLINDQMNFCEVEVLAIGMFFLNLIRLLLADRTAACSMIGCWHDTDVCLSVWLCL